MRQNDTEKTTSLTDRQLAALPHIAASSTLSRGAHAADVSRATLYRWLQDDSFRHALDRLQSEAADFAKSELQALMLKGMLVLSQAMEDPSADIRLRAARATLPGPQGQGHQGHRAAARDYRRSLRPPCVQGLMT